MLSQDFGPINRQIVENIKHELRMQGHFDTGDLERSFTELFQETKGYLTLSATALGYLDELENGLGPGDIDEKKINIPNLAAWVGRKVKPSHGSNVQIALLIIAKWKKEGKPLAGSLAYSRTGSTMLAIEQVFQRNDSYTDEIDTVVMNGLDAEFYNTQSGTI